MSTGGRLVWIIDSIRRQAVVYRLDGSIALLSDVDTLDGEDVLPGFSCPLGEVL